MNKEPNKSKNEPNNEARVLSDEELEGIVGGGCDQTETIPYQRKIDEIERIIAEAK